MDLARFHGAIAAIDDEFKSAGTVARLNKLIEILNQLAGSPGNPDISKNFKDELDRLRASLQQGPLNDPEDETLSRLIDDLELNKFIGSGLFETVKWTIEANQLSPNLAAAALTTLRDRVSEKLSLIGSVNTAFTKLQVEYFDLDFGESEMVISLPVDPETKSLDDLSREAKDWHRICEAIAETFDPARKPVSVRTIASGSWLLYLAGAPLFVAGVAKCLKGVNTILRELIEMKALYGKLVETKAPENVLKGLEDHNSAKVKTDLDQLATTLVNEYYQGTDEGRKNELRNALSQALNRLSRKLADGSQVRLRLVLPKRPEIPEGQEPTEEQKHALEDLATAEKLKLEVDQARPQLDFGSHQDALQKALPAPDPD